MQHDLAVTLEPEVPRFDHARVHGTDRNLVNLLPIDAVEVHPADGTMRQRAVPREADRFEPRVSLGKRPPVLGDLALEEVRLEAVRRQRGVPVSFGDADRRAERTVPVVREDGAELRMSVFRNVEQRDEALPRRDLTDDEIPKVRDRTDGNFGERKGVCVPYRKPGCRHIRALP